MLILGFLMGINILTVHCYVLAGYSVLCSSVIHCNSVYIVAFEMLAVIIAENVNN